MQSPQVFFDQALATRYVAALRQEIAASVGRPEGLRYGNVAFDAASVSVAQGFSPAEAADTVFFGGGTPSLLQPEEIGAIIQSIRERFDVAADADNCSARSASLRALREIVVTGSGG